MDRIGERIRARRMDVGLSQRDLAEAVGVSPSYLNLIEHGKRAAGGSLVRKLALAMQLDVQLLSAREDEALVERVRTAAARLSEIATETARTEAFVSRYPGFARLVAEQAARIEALDTRLRMLSDRITYDPELARALHGVISSVTAIQSAAGILTSDDSLDADWQARFHRNIHDDARRLAETSRALIAYLDVPHDADRGLMTPLEARSAALARTGFHRAHLETGGSRRSGAPVDQAEDPLLARHDAQYAKDAAALPLDTFRRTADRLDYDPLRLSAELGAPLARIMRRLASLPSRPGTPDHGLMVIDGAGAVTLAKPVEGFNPSQGRGCSMWPIFGALGQPGRAATGTVVLPGETARHFAVHALAEAAPHPGGAHLAPLIQATMLLRAVPGDAGPLAIPAGLDCRICQRSTCAARREPSTVTPPRRQDL
ncbi:XRE family transcriptional regulator [Salipiger sp. IMCC34102]|uniref:helix-turn-helix domain-containing protein n=1 Tax=Salipiger sp. IMCC34102 TaxID=2510647 RepID=UPI00101C0CCC|nr:helix-turn-helix transcriptional regulator [Salipiger sp. IMCC34102]RYH02726.1 XRE family transcriptional regulator [Salipiger sp. IMCC34102]